jgi:hypothetical protein
VPDDAQVLPRAEDVAPEPKGGAEPSHGNELEGTLVWSSMDLPGMDSADDHE